jgi:hypothetical protein
VAEHASLLHCRFQRCAKSSGTPVASTHEPLELISVKRAALFEGADDDLDLAIEVLARAGEQTAAGAGRADHARREERVSRPGPQASQPASLVIRGSCPALQDPLLSLRLRDDGIRDPQRFGPGPVLGRIDSLFRGGGE